MKSTIFKNEKVGILFTYRLNIHNTIPGPQNTVQLLIANIWYQYIEYRCVLFELNQIEAYKENNP